jgi:hypothetical protein
MKTAAVQAVDGSPSSSDFIRLIMDASVPQYLADHL